MSLTVWPGVWRVIQLWSSAALALGTLMSATPTTWMLAALFACVRNIDENLPAPITPTRMGPKAAVRACISE